MSNQKVWFVTGASQGLGLALVKKLLEKGDAVAATSRSAEMLQSAIGSTSKDLLPLSTNLGSPESIKAAIAKTIETFGRIDVVVNNAGYGIGGALEEISENELLDSFGINVFATVHVIQAVMPQLRKQRSGHIINISSIAGFAPACGWGAYAGVKFAVMGLTQVLAEDVKEFGIKATVVAPGAFRTNFLTSSSLVIAENRIDDYTAVHDSHTRYASMDGQQAGDPDKAAAAFIALAENENPPVTLFLGQDAYDRAQLRIAGLQAEMEQWKALTVSTGY
ncbi:short-chain dehydrogenase/reductase [Chitinophaga parva]|uniref:Short-chain dehydrogenase/reductase n=1 Tax=Chitinophaga parva TaxID=2169414 RepID=A0A2T7BH69_9BACT|nr:SDR family NAD(P)-dependent oxidoreductase [Chitinophaga parva]PUZ25593.1 short-chain dehydrogenase/reductase [Chitinophaga parva]